MSDTWDFGGYANLPTRQLALHCINDAATYDLCLEARDADQMRESLREPILETPPGPNGQGALEELRTDLNPYTFNNEVDWEEVWEAVHGD